MCGSLLVVTLLSLPPSHNHHWEDRGVGFRACYAVKGADFGIRLPVFSAHSYYLLAL